jgi:hypothetical protein
VERRLSPTRTRETLLVGLHALLGGRPGHPDDRSPGS